MTNKIIKVGKNSPIQKQKLKQEREKRTIFLIRFRHTGTDWSYQLFVFVQHVRTRHGEVHKLW